MDKEKSSKKHQSAASGIPDRSFLCLWYRGGIRLRECLVFPSHPSGGTRRRYLDPGPHPRLTVQNITFAYGNSSNETEYDGGGAIWVRGGRFKVINCRFINNVCAGEGPDVGGGAIHVFDQFEDLPVYVVNSTFGGAPGLGNVGSNGGAISSIGVSWTLINSVFSYNEAIGNGGNPQRAGTPGGGSGGVVRFRGDMGWPGPKHPYSVCSQLCGRLSSGETASS